MKIKTKKLFESLDLIKYLTECRCDDSVYIEDFQHRLDYIFGIPVYDEIYDGVSKLTIVLDKLNKYTWFEITLYLDVINDRKFKLTDYIVDLRKKEN